MAFTYTDAEFEHLQVRVDKLENVLCDIATASYKTNIVSMLNVKKALQDAGILGKG